ncbi:MAG: hypothetical protein KY445_17340, partial [Armatimonadetes bacterium]|nr:hypothetical protein [Armatimonadota bacterium]
YNYNQRMGIFNPTLNRPDGSISLTAINEPAAHVIITDSGANPSTNADPTKWTPKKGSWLLDHSFSGNVNSATNPDNAAPIPRHLDTTNVLYADGHVKSLRVEKFYRFPNAYSPCLDPAATNKSCS